MNIYMITRETKSNQYDVYDGFIVQANDKRQAMRLIRHQIENGKHFETDSWPAPEDHLVLIGTAKTGTPKILMVSFKAG